MRLVIATRKMHSKFRVSVITKKIKLTNTFGRVRLIGPIYTGWRRIIRLGRAWAKNGSSSDNPSVYKYGNQTDQPSWRVIHDGSSHKTNYRDSSRGWMIRLIARIYTQTDYQTSYRSLPKLVPDKWCVSSINRAIWMLALWSETPRAA